MVSIILPTYNESQNIRELIERIIESVAWELEILVIDDNSPDGTSQIVMDHFRNNHVVRLITRKEDRGLRSAVQRGIKEARGNILVWMDCDLSMAPEDIPKLISKIDKGYDIAVGSRYVKGGADKRMESGKPILFFHVLLSEIITLFTSLLLWRKFRDWTSGFIAIRSSLVKDFILEGDYGEYFIHMIYSLHRKNYKIIEVPYHLIHRVRGESKTATNVLGFLRRGIDYIRTIIKLKISK